ncbi:MAG: chromate efflux transporter [Phaeovulum sp.]|uniref:chromate efflux transporter n=1 Tax=Phaeovulum sp. TaxID=2934796 RepID=UPI0027362E5D|nr:chromate efflux transporter [Phaeovulum sp.]MDP3861755.1 chromate efflux transporter [Phaeovulum sp.]
MTPLPELFATFGKIGVNSFGGPAAQIAVMHRVLVDEKRWLSEAEFLRALSFCMLLPGPEAMQLATYAGWQQRGRTGGLIAGGLFVLPGAALILALAAAYVAFGSVPLVAGLFFGVKACVTVIVIEALLRMSRRALRASTDRALALAALVAIFAFAVPFPAIIVIAALIGAAMGGHAHTPVPETSRRRQGGAKTLGILGTGLAIWFAPLAVLALAGQTLLVEIGLYFSKLAVVTFGGAYAVLGYMTQTVVQQYGWVTTGQMIDALGMAETTPGPLILVTEFVGFLAGHGAGGAALGVAAAALTLWVTFVPCFVWIFTFAPAIDRIAARPRLGAALRGITAAVVGVVANLALWFALAVLFGPTAPFVAGPLRLPMPDFASLDLRALALGVAAAVMLLRLRWPMTLVLALSAIAGAVLAA